MAVARWQGCRCLCKKSSTPELTPVPCVSPTSSLLRWLVSREDEMRLQSLSLRIVVRCGYFVSPPYSDQVNLLRVHFRMQEDLKIPDIQRIQFCIEFECPPPLFEEIRSRSRVESDLARYAKGLLGAETIRSTEVQRTPWSVAYRAKYFTSGPRIQWCFQFVKRSL